MKKKILGILLVATMTVTMLTGCEGEQGMIQSPTQSETAVPEETTQSDNFEEIAETTSELETTPESEPTTEASVVEETQPEEPTTEEPTTEAPVIEETQPEEPTTEEATTEAPVIEETQPEEPTTEEPTTEAPVIEETQPEEPTTEEPITEAPVIEETIPEETTSEHIHNYERTDRKVNHCTTYDTYTCTTCGHADMRTMFDNVECEAGEWKIEQAATADTVGIVYQNCLHCDRIMDRTGYKLVDGQMQVFTWRQTTDEKALYWTDKERANAGNKYMGEEFDEVLQMSEDPTITFNEAHFYDGTCFKGCMIKHVAYFAAQGYMVNDLVLMIVDAGKRNVFDYYESLGTPLDKLISGEITPGETTPEETTPEETTPEHEHSYDTITSKEPTCTKAGEITYICDCGSNYSIVIPATGVHTESEWETLIEATCINEGERIKKCTGCGIEMARETLELTGHRGSDWIVEKEPTAEEAGSRYKECKVCKELIIRRDIPALNATGILLTDGVSEVSSVNIAPGSSAMVDAVVLPEGIDGHVEWTGVHLDNVGFQYYKNNVKIIIYEDMPIGTSFTIYAKQGDFSASLTVNVVAADSPEGEVAPNCPHIYTVLASKAATTSSTGWTEYWCMECGHKYKEEIPKLVMTGIVITDGTNEISSIDIAPGSSQTVSAIILPEEIQETVSWSQTATAGVNLVKNGNTVTVKIADDMPVGNSYYLFASYNGYSAAVTINIVEAS